VIERAPLTPALSRQGEGVRALSQPAISTPVTSQQSVSTIENEPNPYRSPQRSGPLPGLLKVPAFAWWALALLLAINLFNYIDRLVLAGVVPKIRGEFKASDAEVGWLQTAFLLSYMIAAPIFGWLADRCNRWLLIGIGVMLWSVASGASGMATGIGMMLCTRLFVGIGEAAYGPLAPTILSDLFPIERRGRILALFYAAIPVGSALGYELASIVVGMGYSWRIAFYCVLPPGLLLGLIAMFHRDVPRGAADRNPNDPRQNAARPRKARLVDYKQLLKTPSYVLNTAGMAAMTFALGGISYWMPTYIVWRHGQAHELLLSDTKAVDAALSTANGIFGPIVVVAGLLGTLAGGWAGDRLRPRFGGAYFLVSGAGMLIGFPLFLAMLYTPFPAAWVLIFIACFCLFFNTGPTNTVLANVVHPAIRAAGYAVNIFIIHALGDAISPPLIGAVNGLFGKRDGGDWSGNMNAGFLAIAISILISGLFWLWGARYLQRDTALAATRISPE
jgi:MFS transporter, Spinster family, sphingosine-1-phosphate transporter